VIPVTASQPLGVSPALDRTAPLVSIVTPVHDAAGTLAETIASIRAQDMSDWELWLVDDASSDGSDRIIAEAVAADPRIHAIRLAGKSGAAHARNAAIEAARGRYIAFLDADDLWDQAKLSAQLPLLEAGAGFVFSAYRRIDAEGHYLSTVKVPPRVSYDRALAGNPIGCLTAIFDTRVHGRALMPDLPRRQDYALWLRLLRTGGPATGITTPLASYRVRSGSLSSNKLVAARATWRVLRECEALPLPRAGLCFARYASEAMLARLVRR
jgi:teichuronic acid biosynthesis glycosyltransferase TuaG